MSNNIRQKMLSSADNVQWEPLKERANLISRGMLLEICVRLSLRVPGNIVEFGVADGSSTRVIVESLSKVSKLSFYKYKRKHIYALDSFEGLREQFENAKIGAFAQSKLPKINGAKLVKGYFEDTCNEDLRNRVGKVAFAHLDADLFDSTLFALKWLTPMLSTGSILLFDEFIGGNEAEKKAFEEWQTTSGVKTLKIGEFARDPSGWGDKLDKRALFQVIKEETLDKTGETAAWKWAWRAKRLGLSRLESRIKNSF